MKNRDRIRRLFHKQDGKCHYCKTQMALQKGRHDSATVDHVTPKAHGGTYLAQNIVGACWTCNNARGDTPYEMFKRLVDANGRPTPHIRQKDLETADEKHRREVAVARKAEILSHPGKWSTPRLTTRPYLREIDKHPILAEALIDAGLAERPRESDMSEVNDAP